MVRWMCVWLTVLLVQPCFGQEQTLDLGVIAGETGTYQSAIEWVNPSSDTMSVLFWSDSERFAFNKKRVTAIPNQTVAIPFTIAIDSLNGDFKFNFRILDPSGVILQEYYLEGQVLQAVEDIFRAYRNIFWPFRAKNQVFNLKSGFVGDTLTREFTLYNFGGKTIDLQEATISPYYKVKFTPSVVPHASFAKMELSVKSDSSLAPGFTREVVHVKDKNDTSIFSFPVQFTLEYQPLAELSADAPYIAVSSLDEDFKVMDVAEKDSVQLSISNVGRGLLKMEKIESNCECLQYKIDTSELQPGESTALTVIFDATNRLGYERKTLAIFSNDPRRPTTVITVRAHVKE